MRPRRRPPSTTRSDVLEEATSASTGWARMVTLSTWTSGYFSPHPATVSEVRASSSWANRAFESSAGQLGDDPGDVLHLERVQDRQADVVGRRVGKRVGDGIAGPWGRVDPDHHPARVCVGSLADDDSGAGGVRGDLQRRGPQQERPNSAKTARPTTTVSAWWDASTSDVVAGPM